MHYVDAMGVHYDDNVCNIYFRLLYFNLQKCPGAPT